MFDPRYIITHTILKNIASIEASREVIDTASLVPSFVAQFRKEVTARTIYYGSHLEGNGLTQDQVTRVVAMEESHAEPVAVKTGIYGRDRDVQEILNYRRVVEWIHQTGTNQSPMVIDEKVFKELHAMVTYRILPVEERGVYRSVAVVLQNSQTGEVTFEPPKPAEIPSAVANFFGWLHSESGMMHHSVLRAGIAHYELARIHPFMDGNGRVARALSLLLLFSEGYDVKRFFSLEEYFDKDQVEYYRALQSVGADEDDYDLTYWLEYFTYGLAVELDSVKQTVLRISSKTPTSQTSGVQVALSERQIQILDVMKKQGGTGVSSDFEEAIPDVSVDTLLRDLKDMIKKGLVRKRGKTKGAYYELVEK